MRSLRWKIALWFAGSLLAVLAVFATITLLHLRKELRDERWERFEPGHEDWVLHGSYSESEVEDIAGELLRLALLYALPIAGIALLVGLLLARRSLAPVEALNRQLREIGARSLGRRINVQPADREFAQIEQNINELLARLERSFGQLTEFSAQVAHELRTPLTLLRLQLEDAAGRIEPELAESLQEELARLADYVDQCLLLATAEQGRLQLQRQSVAVDALVLELADIYRVWAAQSGRTVTCSVEPGLIADTDPRYLRQILHIALSNAMKHGRDAIELRAASTGGRVVCHVVNPTRPASTLQPGCGFGLKLAGALATALGGELSSQRESESFVLRVAVPIVAAT